MDAEMINAILRQVPELAGTGFLESASYSIKRSLGADQGDSTGDEGTSSDDSDDEDGSGIPAVLTRALRGRAKIRNLTSLKHICLHTIIQSESRLAASNTQKSIFLKIGEKHPEVIGAILTELRPRDQIPYYKMMERFERCSLEFIGMLLHKNLEEFNFDLLKDKLDASKMWPALIKMCPNLKKICSDHSYRPKNDEALPIRQLMHFKKLVEISMPRHTCDDFVMEKIACTFPKLKSLEVTFDKLSARGLSHLFKLKHLERLEYFLKASSSIKQGPLDKYNNTLIGKCLENLPNLRFCQPHRHSSLYMTGGLEYYYKRNKSSRMTLKLEALRLEKKMGIPPESVPMVKEVVIEGPISCAKQLAQLGKLESLDFHIISAEDAMLVLKERGRQLKNLKIDNEYMGGMNGKGLETSATIFDFFQIFHCCPNLEVLNFGGTKLCEDLTIQLTEANFSKLCSVEIMLYDMHGYQMPMPIVEHILRAENLEHLHLYWTRCLPKALFNVLAENNERHFRKLKFLYLKRMWVKNLRRYIQSLKLLISRTPNLKLLGIDCCEQGVEEFKNSGLHQLLAQIPGFEFMTDYKDGFY